MSCLYDIEQKALWKQKQYHQKYKEINYEEHYE